MDFTLYNALRQLTKWLFPANCGGCLKALSQGERFFCDACDKTLPYLDNYCTRCGQPFSDAHTGDCGQCLAKPPAFDRCFCPFEYASPISDDICRLKYAEQPQVAKRLASMFVQELKRQDLPLPNALVSVPMHNRQLRKRGFNQSTQLAKQLSKQLNLPIINGALIKDKLTPRQATQTLAARKNNLKGSFKLQHTINYKHLAVVDDVVTSGATAQEIAKILKKNGVDYVHIWGVARTL